MQIANETVKHVTFNKNVARCTVFETPFTTPDVSSHICRKGNILLRYSLCFSSFFTHKIMGWEGGGVRAERGHDRHRDLQSSPVKKN